MLRRACLVAISLAMLMGPPALAQTPEEKETARALMDAGNRRLEQGDLVGALEAFQSADDIMRVPTTGLARGRALEQLGRLTEAVDVLRRAARHPEEAGESEAFTKARREAAKLDKEIAGRIPSVVIVIRGPQRDAVTLEVDGRAIDDAAVGLPLRLDPGRHAIRVAAPGYLPQELSVELVEAETESRTVTLERDPNAPAQSAEPDPGAVAPNPSPLPPPVEPGFTVPTVSIVAFAVAGARLVAGAITGGLSIAEVSDLEEACPEKTACSPDLESDHDTMLLLANISNVSFAVAGAATLVGLVTLFTVEDETGSAGARIFVGPSRISVEGRF